MKPNNGVLYESSKKLLNDFLRWFNEFIKWAIEDVWLINSINFSEEKDEMSFYWDSPSYDFEVTFYNYDGDFSIKVNMTQPIYLIFEEGIKKEVYDDLRTKIKRIYDFYNRNKEKVFENRIKALTNIFQVMNNETNEN